MDGKFEGGQVVGGKKTWRQLLILSLAHSIQPFLGGYSAGCIGPGWAGVIPSYMPTIGKVLHWCG